MKDAVRAAWLDFSIRFEGYVPWLYLDVLGLVTIGVGNLVDPLALALELPFVHRDGSPASREEVWSAWFAVKNRQDLAKRGHLAFEALTHVRMTREGVEKLVLGKLVQNELVLVQRWPGWHEWPADAQLGALSMAWAAGPKFYAPKFTAAAAAKDFLTCAKECRFQDANNPGLRPRNDANQVCFQNAARVLMAGLDPYVLRYPTVVLEPVEV